MKKIAIIIALALAGSTALMAQRPEEKGDWRQKMMSEKIAFITSEVGLTPEEAQLFWPVYNQISEQKDLAFRNVAEAFKNLENAVKEGKDWADATNAYLKAQDKSKQLEIDAVVELRKVLSEEKVAKLYVAEENFRRNQIHKLHKGNGPRGERRPERAEE